LPVHYIRFSTKKQAGIPGKPYKKADNVFLPENKDTRMKHLSFPRMMGAAFLAVLIPITGLTGLTPAMAAEVSAACKAQTYPVYQTVNPATQSSLLTRNATEITSFKKQGFTEDKGTAFKASNRLVDGLVPVYRMVKGADYLWVPKTAADGEYESAKELGYASKYVEFYASKTQLDCSTPVYRYVKDSLHRYTASPAEQTALSSAGWANEGVMFWAAPGTPVTTPTPTTPPVVVTPTPAPTTPPVVVPTPTTPAIDPNTVVEVSAPVNVIIPSTTVDAARVSWSAPTTLVGKLNYYTVTISSEAGYTRTFQTLTNTVVFTGLPSSTKFTATVTAMVSSVDGSKKSSASASASTTTLTPQPITPPVVVTPTPTPTTPPVVVPSPEPTTPPVVTPAPYVDKEVPVNRGDARKTDSGSAPIGSTKYAVPANAIFVATTGNDTGTGSASSPYRTIQKALNVSTDGQTVVVREGTYHEFLIMHRGRSTTLQSYPGEKVWLDGSRQLTEWNQTDGKWVVSNWDVTFDTSPTYTRGQPDGTAVGWSFVNPQYPMAAHPDQVWINGVAQKQVGSVAEVKENTFFVDTTADKLYLGTNPAGKDVRASDLVQAISMRGDNSTVQGIGVRRYSPSVPDMGTVVAYAKNVKLENVSITDNSTTGLNISDTLSQTTTLRCSTEPQQQVVTRSVAPAGSLSRIALSFATTVTLYGLMSQCMTSKLKATMCWIQPVTEWCSSCPPRS
jgi:hypothetical protein